MGSMNAMGHVLAVSAGGDLDELWRLGEEMSRRLVEHFGADAAAAAGHQDAVTLHSLGPGEDGGNRCCFHPTSSQAVEFRGETLREALEAGVVWLAKQLPEHEMWRRD